MTVEDKNNSLRKIDPELFKIVNDMVSKELDDAMARYPEWTREEIILHLLEFIKNDSSRVFIVKKLDENLARLHVHPKGQH